MESFSERHGHHAPEPPITIRDDAPKSFRGALVMLGEKFLASKYLRFEICSVLLEPPDSQGNWSPENVVLECRGLVENAPWPQVYDIAEALYRRIDGADPEKGAEFEKLLNRLLVKSGIGYAMEEGLIVARGSEAFDHAPKVAIEALEETGTSKAVTEMKEAMRDINRRPPDLTGSIQHSMAALECLAKHMLNEPSLTLGKLIPRLDLPKPLDEGVDKLWGYASQFGRHAIQGKDTTFEEAEFIVTLSAGLCTLLARRQK